MENEYKGGPLCESRLCVCHEIVAHADFISHDTKNPKYHVYFKGVG